MSPSGALPRMTCAIQDGGFCTTRDIRLAHVWRMTYSIFRDHLRGAIVAQRATDEKDKIGVARSELAYRYSLTFAARRLRVTAALRAAARLIRVLAAFRPAPLRLRVIAALRPAALSRRVLAAF